MDKIKYIIDFDGFALSMGFLIKEACILNVADKTIKSYFFNLGDYALLGAADKRQVNWLTNHLHGLSFSRDCRPTDLPSQEAFTPILCEIIEDCRATGTYIAYKGGIYERDIIKSLGGGGDDVVTINLEIYDCPTARELLLLLLDKSDGMINLNCGRHISKTSHCPKLECYLYYKWLFLKMNGKMPTILSEHF